MRNTVIVTLGSAVTLVALVSCIIPKTPIGDGTNIGCSFTPEGHCHLPDPDEPQGHMCSYGCHVSAILIL